MKRLALLLSLLCLSAAVSRSASDNDQFIPIPVLDNTIETGRTHRAPAHVPIQAYYDGLASAVCLTFLQDMGDVKVSIANLSNGDYVGCDIDSGLGSAIIPISGTSGTYQIRILLQNGKTYGGHFDI